MKSVKSGGFHPEIWRISPWNLADFMKSMKSGGFHPWNLADFTQISPVKSTQNYKSKCFSKNSSVWWTQGGGFHPEIWWISPMKSGRFHLWNPPKIIKASVSAKTLQFDECRVGDFTLKSGGFHLWNLAEFTQISPVKSTLNYKSKCFSKNSSVWWMQGGGYDQGFHEIHPEIWWISTMKSGRFHPDFTCEIHPNYKSKCFSKNSSVWWMQGGGFHPRNLVDFTLKSGGFQPWNLVDFTQISPVKSTQNYKSKCFSKNFSVWWMQGGGFHPGNPVDFTLKSGGFHPWNLADFTQVSPVKSTQNYKSKCFSKNSSVWWMQGGGFHPGNPVDFTLKSGGFDLWNLVDFTQIWPVKSTLNYKSKCFSKNSSVWWMQGGGYDQGFHEIHQISPWNLGDLTCEIQWISPRYHLWNPPKIIKASVLAKTLQFDECRVGDFTLKSGGFVLWNLVDLTQIWPVKSTQNYKSKCFSKNSSVWWMQGGGFHPDFTCEIHPKL